MPIRYQSKRIRFLELQQSIVVQRKMHPPCCHLIILSLHTQGSVALRAIGRGAWMIQQLGPVDVRFPKKAKGRNFRNLKKWTEIRSRAKPSRLWIEQLILCCSHPKITAICGCSSTHSYRKNLRGGGRKVGGGKRYYYDYDDYYDDYYYDYYYY